MTTITIEAPTLTREELKNHVILLHCTTCNRVTKHASYHITSGKPVEKRRIQIWQNHPRANGYKRKTRPYKRVCTVCGHVIEAF